MEKLMFEFAPAPAVADISQQVLVGVVGSGDLEVLVETQKNAITIEVTTSVDGMSAVWQALMQRLFSSASLPGLRVEINDFGATPGVVRMRVEQALEQLGLLAN